MAGFATTHMSQPHGISPRTVAATTILLSLPFRLGLVVAGLFLLRIAPGQPTYGALSASAGVAAFIVAGVFSVIRMLIDRDQ